MEGKENVNERKTDANKNRKKEKENEMMKK